MLLVVDKNVSEQRRNVIFDAIKSMREKSNRRDTDAIVEYVTRNLANIKGIECRDSISTPADWGILINKKTKQDLDSLFVNDCY